MSAPVVTQPPPTQSQVLAKKHRHLALWIGAILLVGAVAWAVGNPRIDMLFTIAVAPGLFLLWHFHHADKYKSE
ncbi:MAG: hypothetical protein JO199_00090, partial [Candidatus Eremiobacteraeota bacterium]|nr:hypothetical protein [Candidatus Eremiobacteraeota bacterium]